MLGSCFCFKKKHASFSFSRIFKSVHSVTTHPFGFGAQHKHHIKFSLGHAVLHFPSLPLLSG